MSCKEHEKIIAFDTLFSTNHTQMLKIILPFMDNQMQKHLAIYIKFLELSYTIEFLKKHPFQLCGCTKQESFSEFPKLCGELLPFCSDKEKKQIEQMRGIFQSMEMYREMSQTMEAMKDFMPDMGDLFQNMQAASFPDFNAFGASSPSNTVPDTVSSDSAAPDAASGTPEKENVSQATGSPQPSAASGFDITSMLMNMMTPEQKEMYEMFKGENNNAE
ncbi:MAG: hypothetical protein IJ409_01960 [Lachnospiraceae bacterium]|nr:hypothetical protein [Lachnospiraceae bacterium]